MDQRWLPVAQKVYAAAAAAAPRPRMLAGPDWSNANMDPKKLAWWMGSVSKYLNMVTVHLYGGESGRGAGHMRGGGRTRGGSAARRRAGTAGRLSARRRRHRRDAARTCARGAGDIFNDKGIGTIIADARMVRRRRLVVST